MFSSAKRASFRESRNARESVEREGSSSVFVAEYSLPSPCGSAGDTPAKAKKKNKGKKRAVPANFLRNCIAFSFGMNEIIERRLHQGSASPLHNVTCRGL